MKRCYAHGHVPGCRPGRPLCRYRRRDVKKYEPCNCGAYHFPHRRGSGLCNHHPDSAKRQWEAYTGSPWDG